MDAETLIAAEVERFHQRQRTVNVAPAIVALQRRAEEIRQGEMQRMHARLGTLTPEQLAAVEALTRGLVNKFLHPPMQALKQAAREGDSVRAGSAVRGVVGFAAPRGECGRQACEHIRQKLQHAEKPKSAQMSEAGLEVRR